MADQSGEPVGAILGNYRIERLLERGGFAAVYVAEDVRPQLKRKVALKVLNQALAADATFRERFLRESLLAVGLDHHQSIVPVYDAGEDNGRLYIAMRFIDGIDLKAAIEEQGSLSPEYVAAVTSQVAGALDTAHAAGLVHRDVKPANVLLSKDRQRAYLADFGLTKKMDADQALTQTPGYMGTTFYSPPEQFEGIAVGPTADIYALGAVIFHCLTGEPPFPGTPESVIGAHLTKAVPRVTERRPDLPPAVNDVIAKAMAKDAHDRYQSAGSLAAALNRAIVPSDHTQQDLPPGGPAGIAGAAAAAGLGGETVVGQPPASAPPATPGPPSTPPGQTPYAPGGYGTGPPSTPPPGSPQWGSGPTDPGSGAKKSRKGLVAALAIVVALVVAGVVAAVLLTGGDKKAGPPSTDSGGTDGSSAFPTSQETTLIDTLPSEIRNDCKRDARAKDDLKGATAAVKCSLSKQDADEVDLISFSQPRDLSSAYGKRVGESPTKVTGDNDCKYADNVSHDYEANNGGGKVACFFGAGDDAFVVWTVGDDLVLGSSSRNDNDSATLYDWWKDVVGRTNEPPALPNPSAQEQALLDKLPADFRDGCQRGRDNAADAFAGELAVVQCFPVAQDGVSSVFYYAFSTVDQMNAAYGELIKNAFVAPNSGGPDCPREGTYDTDATTVGRNACGVFEGQAFLLWTKDSDLVMSELRSVDEKYPGIQKYWESADANPT